jgi:hypothetical protein
VVNVGGETSESGFPDAPDWEIAPRSRNEVSTKANNFDMVHVGKRRYWNIVDNTTEDVTGKLNYWSTCIIEVKIVSAMDEELSLEICGCGKRVTVRSTGEK